MKKRLLSLLLLCTLVFALSGCGEKTLLNKKKPVSLSFWHVYGEQAGSPMDLLVQEFNRTVGQERGVQVQVTGMSSASQIGGYLKDAQSGGKDVQEMPDLFTCHIVDALELGEDNLVPWNEQFTPDELSDFIPGFLSDGTAEDGRLLIFPVSKSMQLLMCNGSGFDRFSAATGVGYEDLATWEGFYDAAGRFYDWSDKPFCALDYPIRAVELNALERGSGDFYTENGWYDTDNAVFKESWMQFARSLAQGHVVVSDLYSNTQVMTGDVLSGLGSSAAILYYNDTVTYRDGTQEPMDLRVLPMPKTAGADALMTQAGVGLCAYRTTEQKAEAAALFVRWLTEAERNLDFVAQTGYMPVRSGAFDAITDYDNFPAPEESYRQLYAALKTMREDYTPCPSLALRATTAGSASFTTVCADSSRSCPRAPQPARTSTRWRRKPGSCSAPFTE
ncbi:MAG: ABC transporter substrate-binding protein [Oscillospiraceae bacterium]